MITTTIGVKSTPEVSARNNEGIAKAVLTTLAFFSLYDLPVPLHTIHQLLYKMRAEFDEVKNAVESLVSAGRVVAQEGLYALKPWHEGRLSQNKLEIQKRWRKVDRYFWLLSLIPFLDHIAIINSLSFGNAHQESDIDFFVVTKPRRLYTVRTLIIILFRLLGVYKTKNHINERFCFGFYVTTDRPELEHVLIEGEDPHFAFWFASFAPLMNASGYRNLVAKNPWVLGYFPNFDYQTRLSHIRKKNKINVFFKNLLEIVLTIPAVIFEPLLRSIHIRHTFNLPENHWPTSTTIANQDMLKLHAIDPRKDIRSKFYEILKTLL